jgi:ABC-type proline/glycine betaine transport system permease subunit
MYIAVLLLLVALGGELVFNGVQRRRPKALLSGALIVLLHGAFSWADELLG